MILDDQFNAARETGRISAVALDGERALRDRAADYGDLLPSNIDAAMIAALAQSTAFIATTCTAQQLRVANLASLWVSAEDFLVERASTLAEVEEIAARCLAVADGAPAVDPLGRLLAEVRDELATAPAYAGLQPVWREELRLMLDAEVTEWHWKTAGNILPTLNQYVGNAHNYGASFVNVTHWIFTSDPVVFDHLDALLSASRGVQQVLRLSNDLASYDRDVQWQDLNALLLVDRHEVVERLNELTESSRELLRSLEDKCPVEAGYLTRELAWTTGFYARADFWGGL